MHTVSFSKDENGRFDCEKDFCMRQGDYYYKIVDDNLIRYYYLDREEKELRRYLNLYTVLDRENKTLSDLSAEVISNHCREAIECRLGGRLATIYENTEIEAPYSTEEEIQILKYVIKQIIKEANKNVFSTTEFARLLRKQYIEVPSFYDNRYIYIKK